MKEAPAHVIVTKGHLHWYGHLIHCPTEHLTLQCLKFEPAGTGLKRLRGKPHVRWMDVIDGAITKLGLQPQQAREVLRDQ